MGCAAATQVDDLEFVNPGETRFDNDGKGSSRREERKAPSFQSRYLITDALGKGAFAKVYGVQRLDDPLDSSGKSDRSLSAGFSEAACKVIDLRGNKKTTKWSTEGLTNSPPGSCSTSERDALLFRIVEKEVALLRRVSGLKYCVPIFDYVVEGHFCYIVMEKCSMPLYHAFMGQKKTTECDYARVFTDMLRSLSAIHALGIVHRDLKPDNYLFCGQSWQDGIVKLCDFGLADTVCSQRPKLMGDFGTAPFMAPEVLSGAKYDCKVDVWSFSVIAYALMFGEFPYLPIEKSSQGMKTAILVGKKPLFEPKFGVLAADEDISLDAVRFVREILVRNPDKRPDATSILEDPWLQRANRSSGEGLPNLQNLIVSARRVGLFTVPKAKPNEPECPMDAEMADLQLLHQGPTPWTECHYAKYGFHSLKMTGKSSSVSQHSSSRRMNTKGSNVSTQPSVSSDVYMPTKANTRTESRTGSKLSSPSISTVSTAASNREGCGAEY